MRSVFKVAVILFLMVGVQQAQGSLGTPKIDYDNNNIYVRVPAGKEWVGNKTSEMAKITAKLMREKVLDMLTSGESPFELSIDTIDQIKESAKSLEEFITVADAYNDTEIGSDGTQGWEALVPSAFIMTLGIGSSLSIGVSGGGSVTIGLVVMPIKEYVIPRRPDLSDRDLLNLSVDDLEELIKESTIERYSASWAFVGWPNFELGVGAGARASARLSGGLIWGPLQEAKDFKGLVAGVSGNATLYVGVSIKAGIVHNSALPGFAQIKYIIAGADVGVAAEVAAKVNASVIFTGEDLLRLFFSGQTGLSGEQIIEEYRRGKIGKSKPKKEGSDKVRIPLP